MSDRKCPKCGSPFKFESGGLQYVCGYNDSMPDYAQPKDCRIRELEVERNRLDKIISETHRLCGKEMDDPTQGPIETCCKMLFHVEEAEKARETK